MTKRILALALGALVFALPAIARADTVTVGNLEKKPLKFSLRCGNGDWSLFTLNSLQNKNWTCANSRVSLQIGTTNADGSITEKTSSLQNGVTYALVKSGNTNDYIAYDTRYMIVVINTSKRSLKYVRTCSGSSSTITVAAADYAWAYAGDPPDCNAYSVAIATTGNDGSETTISKSLALGSVYSLSWSDQRQAWDISGAKQPTAGNGN